LARTRSPFTGPARVLVVADQPLAGVIALALNHGVYDVKLVDGVEDAVAQRKTWRPHLLIVDVDLRAGDPSALIGVADGNARVPTIVLAERGDLRTKLNAFDSGADDFLAVPISPEELVARALALMRRTYGDAIPFVPVIKVGGLEIDLLNQVVRSGSSSLHLTSIEQALLYLLASRPGETMDRESILDALWGSDYVAESNLVDRHIRNLRVKLKNNWRRPRYIATVPGKGYRFLVGP
jgi:DNA-binding response OmpR family regulator